MLVFSIIPMSLIDLVSAESAGKETEHVILFAEGEGEDISLYSSGNDVQLKEPEYEIPDESEAILLQNISTFEYIDQLSLYLQYAEHASESKDEQDTERYVQAEQAVH